MPSKFVKQPVNTGDLDPIARLKQLFVDVVEARRIHLGQTPARRPVFTKSHGVAHGRFEILSDLPEELRVGIFGHDAYPAWVRFSGDAQPTDADLNTTCGIAIKLFGASEPHPQKERGTHDFILQNHDVFFVDTAQDMCDFTEAGVVGGDYGPYLKAHPVTQQILNDMGKVEGSVLTATYWSVLPFAFGPEQFVKYKLEPESPDNTLPDNDPDYLAHDLARRLRDGEVRFRFLIQFRTDAANMPLDRATVRWSEATSAPIHVATLVLPQQDIQTRGQPAYGENLAFNIWNTLPAHRPQGSIAAARQVVYTASATMRHDANGLPQQEPAVARKASSPESVDTRIVRAAIHPAIGVARVGNSPDGFFIGPEVPEPMPEPGYRDQTGALLRQAARFRIYGLNAEGHAIAELDASNAEIQWTVYLANKKSAWYQFQLALDIPEAVSAPPSCLRNPTIAQRDHLVIDPGARNISGRSSHGGPEHTFDTGRFMNTPVYLGELHTDAEGNLLVLGGRGHSASFDGTRAVTFANNDGWHDDTSDGPVTATVRYQGVALPVDPAWVVVAPPNYAPMQKSVRTMWDLLRDRFIAWGMLPVIPRPSFNRDIRPLFERLSHLQWVNAGYAAQFGWRGQQNLSTSEWLERLGRASSDDSELRRTLANHFRSFDRDLRGRLYLGPGAMAMR